MTEYVPISPDLLDKFREQLIDFRDGEKKNALLNWLAETKRFMPKSAKFRECHVHAETMLHCLLETRTYALEQWLAADACIKDFSKHDEAPRS